MIAKLKIIALPLFHDNYSYIVLGTALKKLVLIDPANPSVVLDYLKKYLEGYEVNYLLYTHKHWDHAGGSAQLIKSLNNQSLTVVAGQQDGGSIPGSNHLISEDSTLNVNNVNINIYTVPCHTRGHLLYHFRCQAAIGPENVEINKQTTYSSENKEVFEFESNQFIFTGDTVFTGGVGRFFEGDSSHMLANLAKLSKLNQNIHLFNGHQYTKDNLQWARRVEYTNKQINEYYQQIKDKKCTLPSSIGNQKKINVFMRSLQPSQQLKSINSDSKTLLQILREMKNSKKTLIEDSSL